MDDCLRSARDCSVLFTCINLPNPHSSLKTGGEELLLLLHVADEEIEGNKQLRNLLKIIHGRDR